jgi:hypothetical protein
VELIGVDYSYCNAGVGKVTVECCGSPYLPQIITAGYEIPLDSINADSGGVIAYASPDCANCMLRGSNQKPAFWQ